MAEASSGQSNVLASLAGDMQARFMALSVGQKVVAGTLVLGLMIGSIFLFRQVNEDYDVLYANMSLPDAAAAASKLKELGKPYRLTDGGTTILVPSAMKDELVLETAEELTSDQPVSLTKIPPVLQGDVQKEWLRRFNADTIASTIQTINGIRKAQVIVAEPEQTVFTTTKLPVQASVMLVVEPGFRLKESQIKTIKHLVAHSVPGLKPEAVAISDNFGNSLDDATAGLGASANGQEEVENRRQRIEKELQGKILDLLRPIVGKDNAVVSVSADLNLDQSRAKIHKVVPIITTDQKATGVVVSEQQQQEQYTGAKPPEAAGGETGAVANTTPAYKASNNDGGNGKEYLSTKSTINYAHSEEDREVIYASGTIKRLSVAVALNKVLTTTEMEELTAMISNAAGLDKERGDTIDLRGFQFSQSPNKASDDLNQSLADSQQQEFIIQLVYLGVLVILGLTAIFMFYKLLKQPIQAEWVDEEDSDTMSMGGGLAYLPGEAGDITVGPDGQVMATLPDGTVVAAGHGAEGRLNATRLLGGGPLQLPDASNLPILESPLTPEMESVRAALHATIKHDPSEAARLLVNFMRDEA